MKKPNYKTIFVSLSLLLLISGCSMFFPKPEQVAASCPGLPVVPLAISEYVPPEIPLIDLSAQQSMMLLDDMRNEISNSLKKALGLSL